MINVYGTNISINCVRSIKKLEEYGKQYTFINILKDNNAKKMLNDLGFKRTPMFEVEGDWFSYGEFEDMLISLDI